MIKSAYVKLRPLIAAGGAAFGFVLGMFLPADVYRDVATELITFFGFVIAAVIPAMTLTATALSAGNLSPNRVDALWSALARQMKIWLGMFLLAVFFVGCLIFGKMVGWSATINLFIFERNYPIETAQLAVAAITAGLLLFVLRLGAIGRGITSVLTVYGELAVSEAQERDRERLNALKAAVNSIPNPENHGSFIDVELKAYSPEGDDTK